MKSEPCSELELIAIRACAATLCCGTIKDEWFQKTVAPWLDQFMAAHEVKLRFEMNCVSLIIFSKLYKDLSIVYCKFYMYLLIASAPKTKKVDEIVL